MTTKEWFTLYEPYDLSQLKEMKEEIEDGRSELVEETQMIALNLVIVTKERNPDYSHMFTDNKGKRRQKNEKKGQFVTGRGTK